jgi:tRNA(adenine34) deaminase
LSGYSQNIQLKLNFDFREIRYMEFEGYMREAIELAQKAGEEGEVPVGCVIVDGEGNIIGRGRNRREHDKNALAHAEIEAIYEACKTIGDWRLDGCSLYVTLEPCPMCAGAIINARISKLFYGAPDSNTGSCGSVINLFMENYGHEPEIRGGIMQEQCQSLLKKFFTDIRKN